MSNELLSSTIVQYDFVVAGDILSASLESTGGWIVIFQDCLQINQTDATSNSHASRG